MKKTICYISLIVFLLSCSKNNTTPDSPSVQSFVQMLKSNTYNLYEKNEKGENLWLKMPQFSRTDIPMLIALAKDTTHIQNFPTNPISSRPPYPEGRSYFILGECLLWVANGIITKSGSLDPLPDKYGHRRSR